MECEECGEIFCGDFRCTRCGSEQVFEDELANEILEDEEDSDYSDAGGSDMMGEESD